MIANLALWNQLETTPPEYTREFNRGGFKGTATNPCYLTKKLTEVFGPVGIGWRFVFEEEKYMPGHTLPSGVNGDKAAIHVVRGHLEYKPLYGNGQVDHAAEWLATGPQFGQTTFVGENKNGPFTDEEAPKKSITDCLSKCAVMLGLSADIHLGLWDSNKYLNDPSNEGGSTASKAAPRDNRKAAEPAGPPIESPVWVDIAGAATPERLAEVFDKACQSARLYDAPAIWEEVCKHIAGQFRQINLPDDPASKHVLAGLQRERARLDAGNEIAGSNEATITKDGAPVSKPRGRKKSVLA